VQNAYNEIFHGIQQSLKSKLSLTDKEFNRHFGQYKDLTFRKRKDSEYFQITKEIAFFSGFGARKVEAKLACIDRHLPDLQHTARLTSGQVSAILKDKGMIRNPRKINATVKNAKTILHIVQQHGSFHKYIESFDPQSSLENLLLLKEDLEYRFAYLGPATVYHFLMEMGLPVLKPDPVIMRIFQRLGLVEHEGLPLRAIVEGRKFAKANNVGIRYIDIIFVNYGQEGPGGVCLEKKPACDICTLHVYCKYYRNNKH
jgi:DNA-3-methyladenine glycosylase I